MNNKNVIQDYYMLPLTNDNVEIVDLQSIKNTVVWMTISAEEYTELMKNKGYILEEIKNF